MKEILRKVLKYAIIIGLSFVGVKFMMGLKKTPKINELSESIKLVKVQKVVLDTNTLTVAVYGNLKSLNEIEIFPEVGGILKSENFREGNSYQKGQVIASIDSKELANNLKSQKSSLLNQVAKLVADLKFDFPSAVAQWEKFLGGIQFDAPLPEIPVVNDLKLKNYLAGKNIYTSYFNIQAQEERISKYTITAPFDGVLTEAIIKPGTVIRPGQKIGKFINPSQFELEANVSLANGNKLSIGDKVHLHSNDMAGNWFGNIVRINKTLNEASQNMDVFITVNSPNLYNGMYLFGEINMHPANGSALISRSLLDEDQLFKVADGKLEAVKVNVLQIKEEKAIVTGLKNGDLILEEAVKGAFEGMKVRYN